MEWTIEKTINFIEDYRNSPELWNNKTIHYKDIKIKTDTLKELGNKYECTVDDIKKKIKNLRTAYHRERKRLQQKKSGSSPSKKGKWFAFELLSFLGDVDTPKTTLSTDNPGSDEEEIQEEGQEGSSRETEYTHAGNKRDKRSYEEKFEKCIAPKKARKGSLSSDREEEAYSILKDACRRDECSIYGEHVANELRNLTPRARTMVKHMINEALFQAAMGKYDSNIETSGTVLSSENTPSISSTPSSTPLHTNHCYSVLSEASASTFSEETTRDSENIISFPVLAEFFTSSKSDKLT